MTQPQYTFKILTIGESGVGKTCILLRYVEDKFLKSHLATIGIDFKTKTINVDNKEVKLKIWDTAGQDRFRNITNQYYKGADGIVVVYDVSDENSYFKVKDWMEQIKTNTYNEDLGIVLLGNKCDVDRRIISEEMGRNLAQELDVAYFETSALNGQGINESFEALVKIILKKKKLEEEQGGVFLENTDKVSNEKKKCC